MSKNPPQNVIYPKPRYSVHDCLALLDESRERFYAKVRSGRYRVIKDGRRTYMLHDDLENAARGEAA